MKAPTNINNIVEILVWNTILILTSPARTQPIIVNATADMLKDHLLPLAQKLSANAKNISDEEDQYIQEKRMKAMSGDNDGNEVQEVLYIYIYIYIPKQLFVYVRITCFV